MTAELERVDVVAGQVPLPGMPEEGVLFHLERHEPPEKLSAGRRLTLRQRAQVARGVHPLRGDKARPDLGTCGDCRFRQLRLWHDRTYPKCEIGPQAHSTATDVRAWWPACERFEPGDKVSPDAARWTPEHASRGL